MIFLALLVYLAKVFGGFLLAHLIWNARDAKAMLLKLFLGTGLGTGFSSVFYFLWFWLQLPSAIYPYFELGLLVLLVIVNLRNQPVWGGRGELPSPAPAPKWMWFGVALVCLTLVFCVAGFLLYATQNPHGSLDAWMIWNVSARYIYGAPADWLKIIPQNAWFHPDYPLLLALNNAEGWSILGSFTTRIPIALALVFLLSVFGLLYSSLSIAKDHAQGLLAVIVISSLGEFWSLAAIQYADVPLSYFFLGTGALLYLYSINHETRLLILAGLLAGFGSWTKNEGLSFMLISLMACMLLSVKERKSDVKFFLLGSILPAAIILLYKSITPPDYLFVNTAQGLQQLLEPSRYAIVASGIASSLASFGGWPTGFSLILAAYSLIMWTKPAAARGKIWLPASLVLLQFICYFVVYLVTPLDLRNQLKNSVDRLLLQLLPLALFAIFSRLLSPSEVLAKKTDLSEVRAD